MNNEYYIAKGKLSDYQKQYEQIEMRADAMLIQIRELLNPTNDLLDFNVDLIFDLAKQFRGMQLTARDLLKKIEQIKDTYNIT